MFNAILALSIVVLGVAMTVTYIYIEIKAREVWK